MSRPNQFSDTALQRYAQQYPELKPSVIRECAEWVSSLTPQPDDPSAVLAKRLRSKAEAAREAVPAQRRNERETTTMFMGFAPDGCVLKSVSPVDNAVTRFARGLVRNIREELLAPADAFAIIARQSDDIREAFANYATVTNPDPFWAVGTWAKGYHLEHWRGAQASSPLLSWVRTWGGVCPWKDENHWQRLVARFEAREPDAAARWLAESDAFAAKARGITGPFADALGEFSAA